LFLSNHIKEFIKYFLVGFLVYFVTILPFLFSNSFLNNVIFYSRGYLSSEGIFLNNSPGTFSVFLFIYALLFLLIFINNNIKSNKENLLIAIIIILVSYYLIYNYNPQFCIWIMPFLILYQINNKPNLIFFIGINLFFLNNLIQFGRNTFSVHFTAISSILYGLPSPASIINYTIGSNNYFVITNSILYAVIIFFIFILFKKIYLLSEVKDVLGKRD
jgi:hypothetical protein